MLVDRPIARRMLELITMQASQACSSVGKLAKVRMTFAYFTSRLGVAEEEVGTN